MCFNDGLKRKLRNIVIGLFFLFSGIEYGVIIPTLWLFLQHTFDANESYYSIVLSAYSFSSLISSPVFGAWIDYNKKTKVSLVVGVLFEIGGNFLYFIASTKYLVLAGRLLCGVGDGVGSVLFAQIVRTSSVEERTRVLSLAMAARQIGAIIGPALNLALKECNFYIGPYLVNNYRSPGICMAVIWAMMLICIIICYYDLAKTNSGENLVNVQPDDLLITSERRSSFFENASLWRELLNEAVVVILFTQFIVFFNTSALESLVAPLMELLLGWKEANNSILYTLIGVQAIFVYVLVGKVSKKIADRWLIVIGLAFETMAVVLYLVVLAPVKPYSHVILPTITVGTFLIVLGLPFLAVGGVSLYSKITDERTQGFLQGVRRSFLRIGTILGTLWGGSLYRHLYVLISVMTGVITIAEIMMFISFRRLKVPDNKPNLDETTEEERQPLLT